MHTYILIHSGPDPLQNSSHIQVYVRRWRPSEYKADPTDEVVVSTTGTRSVEELKKKVSKRVQRSNRSREYIQLMSCVTNCGNDCMGCLEVTAWVLQVHLLDSSLLLSTRCARHELSFCPCTVHIIKNVTKW